MKQFTCILALVIAALPWTSSRAQDPVACLLPTQSNVDYSQVVELDTATPTAIIHYGSAAEQFGELWLPRDSYSKHPVVVLIHGGCWLNEYDVGHTHALSTALMQSGYAVWAVEYRRTGDQGGGWPGTYDDIKASVKYAQRLQDYPVDLDRIALVGHSAGGHLALLAGAELDMKFAAVIGLAAIADIEQYALGDNSCQAATSKFMGGSPQQRPEDYKLANPAKRKMHRNTVLIHGDADTIVPLTQAHSKTESSQPRLRIVEGAGHFDMIHPGTTAYQQLLKELAQAFTDGT